MRRVSFLALVGTAVAGTALASALSGNRAIGADEPVTRQLYGSGVHAYFAKDYKEAHDLLTTAIGNKTQDPRVYYFRGLAQFQLGRPDEAKADFKTGADLEATASDDLFNIDRALERCQGKARLLIQDARQEARAAAVKRRLTEEERRYNRIRDNEPNILEGVAPPAKPPTKVEPPKANPASEPAKKEPPAKKPAAGEPTASEPATGEPSGDFTPLREARLPRAPKKAIAAEPKPAPKTVEAPEAEPKAAEPKVAGAEPKDVPVARPASPPGKKATTAMARIVGKMAQQYIEDTAQAIQKQAQLAPGGFPPQP
jgi:tetratricopeptide (TPR) repeat protein